MARCWCSERVKQINIFAWPIPINGVTFFVNAEGETCPRCDNPAELTSDGIETMLEKVEEREKQILGFNFRRLNLHCHTKYSDGGETIHTMALAAKERQQIALVISDHDYMLMENPAIKDSREPQRAIDKYLQECEEAKDVSKEVGIPIIVGIEATLYNKQEGLLFGKDAILSFFNERHILNSPENIKNDIFTLPAYTKENYALIVVHPATHNLNSNISKGLFSIAHGYEIVNSHHLWDGDDIDALKEVCPHGKMFCNIDAHGLLTFNKCYCNSVHADLKIRDENDLINWIKYAHARTI